MGGTSLCHPPLFSNCWCIPCPTCDEDIGNMSTPGLGPGMGPPNMLGPVHINIFKKLTELMLETNITACHRTKSKQKYTDKSENNMPKHRTKNHTLTLDTPML